MRHSTTAVVLSATVCLSLSIGAPAAVGSPPAVPRDTASGSVPKQFNPGRIAFVRDGDVYVMDADGRHARQLTDSGPWHDSGPRWSPDGLWIAFTRWGPNPEVWVVDAYTGVPRTDHRANPAYGTMPAWSPNGRRIAYTSYAYDGQLFTMRPDGTHRQQVTTVAGGTDATPAWSPEGKRIAFVTPASSLGPDRQLLDVVKADGTDAHTVAAGPQVLDPTWSPDGRRLAWGGPTGVKVRGAKGTIRRLTHPRCGSDAGVAWAPDGRRIAFARSCDASGQLIVMRADGSHRRHIAHAPGGSPVWNPDGQRLARSQWDVVTVMDPRGTQVQELAPGEEPAWFGPANTQLTIDARPEPVAKGDHLTVTGTLTRTDVALPAATVEIRFRPSGGAFTTIRRVSTGRQGHYSTRFTARTSGTWKAVHRKTNATGYSSATDAVRVTSP